MSLKKYPPKKAIFTIRDSFNRQRIVLDTQQQLFMCSLPESMCSYCIEFSLFQLRFKVSDDNDDDEPEPTSWSGKARRHPARIRRATSRYSSGLSHSLRSRGVVDELETDEESHSDDSIFQSRR